MLFVYYFGLLVFLMLNQSQHIFGGDSAEFSLVAKTFSVAHPPGYPFYSLLANIVARLTPFLKTPWSVALLSSIPTVITSYVLYRLLVSHKCRRFPALLAATLYIFIFPVWLYSEIPEVFALSNLLVLLITALIISFTKKQSASITYVICLLFGIALSHHHIFLLFIPGWIYLLKTKNTVSYFKTVSPRQVTFMILLFLIGFSFYLYAPLASLGKPPLDWENAQTLPGLIRLFTRSTYGTFKAYLGSAGNILNQLFDIFSLFVFVFQDFRIIGIILIIAGFFRLRKINKRLCNFLLITIAFHVFFLFYTNFTLSTSFTIAMYERFLIPVYLLLIIPLAYGIEYAINFLTAIMSKVMRNAQLKTVSIYAIHAFFIGYLFIVIWQNYQTMRRIPQLKYFETYAKDLLNTPPKNAIFFVGTDNSYFTTAFLHFAEHYRSDIRFVFINFLDKDYYRKIVRKKYPDLDIPENYVKGASLKEFIKRNARHGVYLEHPQSSAWKPYGLVWKYYETNEEAASDSANLVKANDYLWNHVYAIPVMDDNLKKFLHLNVVFDHYITMYTEYSKLLFSANQVTKAEAVMKDIVGKYRQSHDQSAMILVNLYVHQGNCKDARGQIAVLEKKKGYRNPIFATSMADYYEKCDPRNQLYQQAVRTASDSAKQNKSSLSGF